MIFVTGGTGLVGSHIVAELLLNGENVRALVRKSSDKSWLFKTLKWLLKEKYKSLSENLSWIEGDVTDVVSLVEGIKGCSKIYHCAALVSFRDRDQKILHQINVQGTANVINASLACDEKPQICYISSTASIGGKPNKISTENDEFDKDHSNSFYSQTKYLAELEAYRGIEEGLDITIINPCIVLGYGNWNQGPSKFFKNAKNSFKFYALGSNAFVDARDVAKASRILLDGGYFGERFLCTAWNLTFKDLSDQIADGFNKPRPKIGATKWLSEISWRLVSVISFFTGKALITKASSRAGLKNISYSSQKLMDRTGFSFRNFEQSIAEICKAYDQ